MTEFNNDYLIRLMCTIDTGLVTYRHYMPWCYAIIAEEDEPSHWVLELATTKYLPKAVKILDLAAHCNILEDWRSCDYEDFWICCQFLRYRRGEISWATFLHQAGNYADTNGARWVCEEFYHLLNHYEMSEFSRPLEESQVAYFKGAFTEVIEEVASFYEPFGEFFQKYREGKIL